MPAGIRGRLAHAVRVLAHLDLWDAFSHVSVRDPEGRAVLTTPGGRSARSDPWTFSEDGVEAVSLSEQEGGNAPATSIVRREGGGHSVPPLIALDLALYRRRADVGVVAFLAPRLACAFGIVRRPMVPLGHSAAELARTSTTCELEHLPTTAEKAEDLSRRVEGAKVTHLPGVGVVIAASDLDDLLMTAYNLEYSLARMNLVAGAIPQFSLRVVTAEESARMTRERRGSHYRRFFDSLDHPEPREGWMIDDDVAGGDTDEASLKRKVALACRILYAQGTLVAFAEHVSQRLTIEGRWLMSPAGNFGLMRPEEITVLDRQAERISGPEPAPFRFFHRDLLDRRPDVNAIVHTHGIYGRAFGHAAFTPPPVWRTGAGKASTEVKVFPDPDLFFDPVPRARAVAALGQGAVLHEFSHGTETVAPTIEEATVWTVHREEQLRMYWLSSLLGTPAPLAPTLLEELDTWGPDEKAWWRFYSFQAASRRERMQLTMF